MKKITVLKYFFIFYSLILLHSCSNESVLVADEIDNTIPDQDIPPNTATLPCNFDLSSLQANETKVIDCVLDLDGKTINLPENVTLDFDKGDIINGTIIFASGGKIAGELLNSELILEGDVQLIDPIFKFFASRWDIIEGTTTTEIALDNNKNLESLFAYIKELGGTTFQIDKFDAFFEITRITPPEVFFRASDEAINIPSDFTIETTANIVGDRDTRAYSSGDVGETGSHLIHVRAGRNITIDGLNFVDGSKGAITIYSQGFFSRPDSNYKPSTMITIKNCSFKDIRRMAISITDGREIFIEDNHFENTGQVSQNSDGGDVGYSINIEAARRRDDNGVLDELQKAFNIFVRRNTSGTGETVFNNEVSGNNISGYKTGIVVSSNEAYVHDNVLDNLEVAIQLSRANDPRVIDNIITKSDKGITATNTFVKNAEIRGNTITTTDGFHMFFSSVNLENAITQSYELNVIDNTFINPKKISNNIEISGNTRIQPDESDGIRIFGTNSNVTILNNTITEPTGDDRFECINNNSDNPEAIVIENNSCD